MASIRSLTFVSFLLADEARKVLRLIGNTGFCMLRAYKCYGLSSATLDKPRWK